MTALVTPFTERGELDGSALERLVGHQLEGRTDVLVPLGTTGEASVLSIEEKEQVLRIVRERCGDRPVMAGAGSNDTAETIANCQIVANAGADYALVVGPYYNKPPQEGFLRHFEAVATASPIPIVVYNVPSRTGSNISAETILALADHPDIIGVKEASGRLEQASAILDARPDGFSVLSGDDDLTLPMMALGADGVISVAANAAPGLVHELTTACLEGDPERARSAYYRLRPLFVAAFLETNPIPIKAALDLLGIAGPNVRLPLVPASPPTREALQGALVHAVLLET
jgi:4-hydroxy-tetrahydrodipicolinate synthase